MNLIDQAFTAIDRADFVPENLKDQVDIDAPLPIGHGQTISQPYTVRFMLELLNPKPGNNILDLGSGSGWQSALLARIVGDAGHVTALEIIPELYEQSKLNIAKYNFDNITMLNMSGENGYAANAPYDGIIAAAALAGEIPQAWQAQLKAGGRIAAPVRNSIVKLTKNHDNSFTEEEHPGFAFVPFV